VMSLASMMGNGSKGLQESMPDLQRIGPLVPQSPKLQHSLSKMIPHGLIKQEGSSVGMKLPHVPNSLEMSQDGEELFNCKYCGEAFSNLKLYKGKERKIMVQMYCAFIP